VNEREREQLQAELVAEREELLAIVSGVEQRAHAWPTRNPDWAVRDVLAHVLASDKDLIEALEAAGRSSGGTLRLRGEQAHRQEMAGWTEARAEAIAEELRLRGERWRELLGALPGQAFATPVDAWWAVRTLGDFVASYRGHDRQHGRDVRLALAQGGADEKGSPLWASGERTTVNFMVCV
jgi:hypothetical protein